MTTLTAHNSEQKSELKQKYKNYIGKRIVFIFGIIVLIILFVTFAIMVGTADLSLHDIFNALLYRFFPNHFESEHLTQVLVWKLRLPRIVMGILAGLGLGAAGCTMQSVLRNPLADPYMLGVASSATFGASLAILIGSGIFSGQYMIIGNAFIFALLCSFLILGLSSRKGATPQAMILTGVAMMFLFSALTTFLQYFAEAEAVKAAVFWTIGDLGKATWEKNSIVAVVIFVCIPLLIWKAWDMNIMGAGDESAKSLGVKVERVRIFTMVVTSLMIASIVSFTGTIGFIGLVAPHITRMVIGGDNRYLLPASALVGAALLLLSDTIARLIMAPVILPVGIVTAFLGVPLFIYLIMKKGKEYW